MTQVPTERLNIAEYFLDARVQEGLGKHPALLTEAGALTYADVQDLANRFGRILLDSGVEPEHRVLIALPDVPEFAGALFGTLKLGAVAVMANPGLPQAEIEALLEYTRARALVVHRESAGPFRAAARGSRFVKAVLAVGEEDFDRRLDGASSPLETFPSHRDDPAIWLFSGGTTGRPKAVVQTHRSFANTTECYGKQVIGYTDRDITLSVPKLYFGYATGSNLFFPFAVGARAVLFPEPATADVLFQKIRRFRPTVLINVPTMINKMVSHPRAREQDLSSIRVCTSAGEALPEELYRKWKATFGVELLDGLGTAEMWHIFVSNRIGSARPGTLGTAVPGFEVRVCDEEGRELPDGETGWLWVRGDSRAIGYWQHMEKTMQGFRGDWYVSGDMITKDAEGYITYCGRGDELMKVAGKWLAPQEVEGCLLQHPAVAEVCVVGIQDKDGLVKPRAYVVCRKRTGNLEEELKAFVRERLDPYKHPREVVFVDALPRTHLGKVDRGALRRS
ncbi:MAG: benzoate-CoA ligase family protein [Candidatus Eisenbacteria bacterium]|uniref:Benzoate-CoA ligase family protein n=1 Tax=Eiseniibacteriota bacterium TaxID=2212470 RepID=A0A538T0Y4_UNCEI|nr:MAG: benzoate-CoA ligase family protein [Candidatus Eisenbacteria bacterium]